MPAPIPDAVWVTQRRYKIDKNGCWVWVSSCDEDGYPKCGYRAGQTLAHRAFYVILVGPIPAGTELDHLCKNPSCVNPAHLEPVTHAINISRGDYAKNHRNRRKTHCIHGHEFTPSNTTIEPTKTGTARKCKTCKRERERASRKALFKHIYRDVELREVRS